jgi:hypothetical protein
MATDTVRARVLALLSASAWAEALLVTLAVVDDIGDLRHRGLYPVPSRSDGSPVRHS